MTADRLEHVKCYAGDPTGLAQVVVRGGTPDYSFVWAPTVANIKKEHGVEVGYNLPAGEYEVTVTDLQSCIAKVNFEITQPKGIY